MADPRVLVMLVIILCLVLTVSTYVIGVKVGAAAKCGTTANVAVA